MCDESFDFYHTDSFILFLKYYVLYRGPMYVRSLACTMSLCMYVEYTNLYCHDFFACTDFLCM